MSRLFVADPYVKVSLMCHGRRIKKKKTHVKKSTLNPVYNEAIVFDVPRDSIEDVSLLVNVIDYDRYWLRRSQSPTSTCCGYAFVCAFVRSSMWMCVRSLLCLLVCLSVTLCYSVCFDVHSFVCLCVCVVVKVCEQRNCNSKIEKLNLLCLNAVQYC